MPHIAIISASVRTGRKSHRVALYLKKYLEEHNLAPGRILDLREYDFPLFEERLSLQQEASAAAADFAEKLREADGVILVTPEYNGGYPASLKNAIDLLAGEWYRKPVAIATVSDGAFGGSQVITSLQFVLWKLRAWTVPARFLVPFVDQAFDEAGNPHDPDGTGKRLKPFLEELLWCIEARRRMERPE